MKLVCIVGKKRSGKDTCANFVANELNSMKYQLAQPIKETLHRAYNIRFGNTQSQPNLNFDDWEGNGEWDRERPFAMNNRDAADLFNESLMILSRQYRLDTFGTDGGYKVQDVVEKLTLNNREPWTIRRFMQTLGTDIVVDELDRMFWMKLFADTYFDNMYSDYDYFVVPDVRQVHEIETLRAMGATIIHVVRPDAVDSEDLHITEAGLPIGPTDIVIENNGTVEELFEKLKKVL
ncbi:dNMP kinase [Edwardsiella phage PEi20]|uniref:DNMP kinase n=2 Tax=Kanagawavirus pei20 TaxID=2844109 RepID=A0A0B6VTV8_9CAUD|nr:dNMP kinase [Edwardsiella phage PEi20]BAQ22813.1 dNMP kinase [Edwardsiella phage PEi20]BAQ23116.1 dNMP kinase [Edwardsiella phage PEi26]